MRYGVTEAGYELLEKTGLDKRIDEKWNDIIDLIPHGAFVNDWEIEDILKKDTPPERRNAIKKWLKENDEYNRKPEDLFMISGTVTDTVIKEGRDNFKQFGVESLGQLDGLLAAYSLAKYWDNPLSSRGYYTWRSKGFKTQIYGDSRGDLQINQVNLKPKVNINIDGTKVLQLFGELPSNHISASYEFWPILPTIALKYADTLGLEIPEAKKWQELMRDYGWNGEIKKPSLGWGVGYDRFVQEFNEDIITQLPDKTNIREIKKMFFGCMCPNASHGILYLPVIDLEQRLVFYSNSGVGESIELAPYGKPTKCYPLVYFQKEDASHLFKGAVHGIMTHQSRTRPEILAHIFWEHDQIKAGKSEEEIRKEGEKFEKF